MWNRIPKNLEDSVEDFRIDFEDGFGVRSDEEEDTLAFEAAQEVAQNERNSFQILLVLGLQILTMLYERSISTLDIFLSNLLEKSRLKPTPFNFVVLQDKVFLPEQVQCLVQVFEDLKALIHSLKPNSLKMEIMIELHSPSSI